MFASPARAQIYSWRGADGHLTLSNMHKPDGSLVAATTPRSDVVESKTYAGSATYDDLINEHARKNGVREDLVRAVVQVESAFNPYARSPKGALGLMQLMPATARRFGVINPYNPADNVRAGVAYLRELLDRYGDDEQLALAAYNAGPGAVDNHGQNVPPYAETRNYVSKVKGIAGEKEDAPASRTQIYRVVEIIDGREVVRYTDRRPK